MSIQVKAGFTYLVEVVRDGRVIDSETVHNLMPAEGLNHVLGVTFKGESQVTSWFVGLFEGNYTPVAGDTAASFPGSATECTAYSEATRRALTLGAIAAGSADNTGSRAEFTMNANKTVYGGFVTSASAKGATTGTLISAVRFASAKSLSSDDVLRVTAGFTLASE